MDWPIAGLERQRGSGGRRCAASPLARAPRLGECGTERAGAPRGASILRGAAGAALRAPGPPRQMLRSALLPRPVPPACSPNLPWFHPQPGLPAPCRGPSAAPGMPPGRPFLGAQLPSAMAAVCPEWSWVAW